MGSAREALRFWTPARMRQARPLGMVRRGGGGLAQTSVAAVEGDPALDAQRAESDFAAVPDTTASGFRQHGAVFIVLPDGFGVGRCSGTAVHSRNRSVVITAGHCVNQSGRWFNQDWVFVPGYNDGVRPFGVFVARWLGTTPGWAEEESMNADVGAAVVSRNERGQTLGEAVGGYEIAFGLSPNQVFDVHGYPAAPPFDGTSQRLCDATPFLGHDIISFLQPGPLNMALTCAVAGGASGGGWTIRDRVLNGVSSYRYRDDASTAFGPYFGAAVRDLYERAERVK
jgi:V8-like Glu-specific endopeptidase